MHASVSSTLGGVSMMTIFSLGATNSFSSSLQISSNGECLSQLKQLDYYHYHCSTGKIYYFGEDVNSL